MKKITFIVCLLMTSLGFAQILIEDFEGPVFPILSVANGAILATPSAILADPAGVKDDVLAIISTNAGAQPWQQTELLLQNGNLDLTGTDKTVSVDWYSIPAFSGFIRVDNVISGVAAGTAEAVHPGGGWATLVFDFNNIAQPSQTPNVPNGVYRDMYFFNHWNIAMGDFNNPFTGTTTYIDNIIGPGTPPSIVTNWTGATNNDWTNASNWDNGVPNTPAYFANIPYSLTAPSPTATGAVNVEGVFMEAGASFIANAAVTGEITYERNLSSTNWHYIASPVIGQDVDDFVAASNLETGTSEVAFCTFDTAANYWVFYPIGSNTADVLNPGQGYIVNLQGPSGAVSFTGTMNTGNTSVTLETTGEGYNLLGNPYPSYLDSNALLTTNSGSLFSQTLWVWNQATGVYDTKIAAEGFLIAPGQGFFVQSSGGGGNVAINEAFQSHQGLDDDTFQRTSADRTEVYLTLSDGTSTEDAKIYYIEDATTSFDNGYDGPAFRAFANTFSIYTHLVTNGFGRDYAIQSLPNNDYENTVVPVGVTIESGKEFTISGSAFNLPTGIDIYLEDRVANTFTLLNNNSNFTLMPTSDLEGTGRFYLHTSSSTLGVTENTLAYNLQIYTTGTSKELIIKGQLSGLTNAKLYDVQGKLVMSKVLQQSNNSNTLDISNLGSGVYVVKVSNDNQSKTQKLVIK